MDDNDRVAASEAAWRDLCLIFKGVSFFKISRSEIRVTAGAYGRHSNDHVTLNLLTDEWKEALSRLKALDVDQLSYLAELSQINVSLLDPHVTRKAALYFGVYPALLGGLAKFIGGELVSIRALLPAYLLSVCAGAVMFLNFYQARWQANEIAGCIKLSMARARLKPVEQTSIAHDDLGSSSLPG
ncbi:MULTISPECIES: hypothetical protein [unclassified Bradyrhizobium]|uniref:hypothetical protein n=1 Tax=unclassified Bradyrhizobium TaxID=2631580 RepID=UPI0028EC9EBC|nr:MULTISPECIES: hypothetical protein [unclassified Bradyrhizobium]